MNPNRIPEKAYYDCARQTQQYFDKDQDGVLNKEEFGHMIMQL